MGYYCNQSGMKISSENKLGQFKQTFCNGGERSSKRQVTHNCGEILRVFLSRFSAVSIIMQPPVSI